MRGAAAIVVGLLAAAEVRADLPPGLPGVEWGYPLHVIESGRVANPEYVFVLYERWGNKEKARYVELTHDQPIALRVPPHTREGLFIVPRTAADTYKSALDLALAVQGGEVPGATRHWFEGRIEVPVWHGGGIIITYYARQTETGDGLELIQTNWKHPLRELNLVVGFLTLTLVFGGIWLVRRRRKRRAAAAVAAGSTPV